MLSSEAKRASNDHPIPGSIALGSDLTLTPPPTLTRHLSLEEPPEGWDPNGPREQVLPHRQSWYDGIGTAKDEL